MTGREAGRPPSSVDPRLSRNSCFVNGCPSAEMKHRADDAFGVGPLQVERSAIRSLQEAASTVLRTSRAWRRADGRTRRGSIE